LRSVFPRLLAILITRVAPALVVAASLASPVLAQSRIEGVVKTLNGAPLAGATVIMEVPGIRKSASTVTDEEGRFAFADVTAGLRVHLIVTKNGQEIIDQYPLVTLWVEKIELQERPVSIAGATSFDVLAQRGTGAEIDGVVRDALGLPVPAARVTINQTTLSATTDSAGRYAFGRIRSGIPLELHVSASGYKPAQVKIEKTSNTRLQNDITLEPDAGLETAGAVLSPVDTTADGNRTLVRPAQVAGIPSLSRTDVFRGLQFMPGVTGSMESNGDLYVRGSAPDQTLISLDGITLYPSSHVLNSLGPLNAGIIKRAVFTEGVPGAADGGHLSGALRLTQQPDVASGAGGYFDLSMLGPAGVFNIPTGDKGAIMVAARRSPTNSGFENVLDLYMPTVGQANRNRPMRWSGGTFALDPTSGFWDLNTKADFTLSPRDRLSLTYYGANDHLNNSYDLAVSPATNIGDPSTVDLPVLPGDGVIQVSDVQRWSSSGLGASWGHLWSSRAGTRLSFSRSDQTRDTDNASLLTSTSTNADYSFLAKRGGSNASTDSNNVVDTTVRLESGVMLGFKHALSAGAEFSSITTEYLWMREVVSAVRLGGPYTSTLAPALLRNTSGNSLSFFVQDSERPIPRLVLTPGLRMSYFSPNSSWYLDPRINGMFQLTPWMRIKGGLSVDHQLANRLVREDRAQGDGQFWTLADGTIVPVPRTEQISGGFTLDSGNVRFEVNAYRKSLEDVTLFAPRLVSGVAPVDVNSLFYRGTGNANGADASIQHQNERNTFWLAYAYGLSEYSFPTLEAGTIPASFDHKNELKITDSVQVNARLSLTGAWVVASGRPNTPASGTAAVWFPSGAAVYDLTYGGKNSQRLPAYHRLDITAQWDFRLNKAKSTIGVSVFNVYNQDNISGYRYQSVGNLMKTDPVFLMGRAVNVFARIGF